MAPDGAKESFLAETRGGERNREAYELAKIIREHFYFRPDQGLALSGLRSAGTSRPQHWKGGDALGRSRQERNQAKRLERVHQRESRRVEYREDNIDHAAFIGYLWLGKTQNPLNAMVEDVLAARKRLVACIDHEAFYDELADYTDRPAPGCLLAHHCQGELLDGVTDHPAGDDGRTFFDFADYDDYQQRNYDIVAPLLDKLREGDYAAYFFPAGSPDDIQPTDDACQRDCQLPFPDRAVREWLEWAKQNPSQANKKLDALIDHHLADHPAPPTSNHEPAWKDFEVQRRLALLAQKLTNVVAGSDKLLPGLKMLYETQQQAKKTTQTQTAEHKRARADSHKLKQDVADAKARLTKLDSRVAEIENNIERTRQRQTWARLEADEAAKRLHEARARLRSGYTELEETGNKAAAIRDQRLALETRLRGAASARALATKSASHALARAERLHAAIASVT